MEAHRAGNDPSKLLDAALACFETLLAYCAQLALVMARTANVDLGGYTVLRKKLAGGGVVGTALGDWIRILDEVASSKSLRSLPQDHPLGELRTFLKSSDQDDVTTARINLTARATTTRTAADPRPPPRSARPLSRHWPTSRSYLPAPRSSLICRCCISPTTSGTA